MALSKVPAYFKFFVRARRTKSRLGIHSAEEFRAILENERCRADRNHHEFSLVVFDIGNPNAGETHLRCLARVLTNRIRCTDIAGWIDDQNLAVLLPDTSSAGAWRLADNVCKLVGIKIAPPNCTVFNYPFGRFSNSDGPLI
jgi:GGDEF domain-containing protein